MLSASAATSGPMRSKGASARRDSRPGRRTGTAVQPERASGCPAPPPAWGKQKSRGRDDAVLLALRLRKQLAFLRRERLQAWPGAQRRHPHCLLLPPRQEFLEGAGIELLRILQGGAAR